MATLIIMTAGVIWLFFDTLKLQRELNQRIEENNKHHDEELKRLEDEFFVAGRLFKWSKENKNPYSWEDCQVCAKWVVTGEYEPQQHNKQEK